MKFETARIGLLVTFSLQPSPSSLLKLPNHVTSMFWFPSSWYLIFKDTRFNDTSIMFIFVLRSLCGSKILALECYTVNLRVNKVYWLIDVKPLRKYIKYTLQLLSQIFFVCLFFFSFSFCFFFLFCLISRRIQMISKVRVFFCFQFPFSQRPKTCNFLVTNFLLLIIYYGQFNSDHHISRRSQALRYCARCENKPSENDARDLGKERTRPPYHQPHPFLHILEPGTGYHHIVECIRA